MNLIDELVTQVAQAVTERIEARQPEAAPEAPDFCFTEEEAAARLKIKPSTLAAYRRNQAIDYVVFGRRIVYLPEHLTEFLAKHEVRQRRGLRRVS